MGSHRRRARSVSPSGAGTVRRGDGSVGPPDASTSRPPHVGGAGRWRDRGGRHVGGSGRGHRAVRPSCPPSLRGTVGARPSRPNRTARCDAWSGRGLERPPRPRDHLLPSRARSRLYGPPGGGGGGVSGTGHDGRDLVVRLGAMARHEAWRTRRVRMAHRS